MAKFYLYRVKEAEFQQIEKESLNKIKIDYLTEEVNDGDLLIVFISRLLSVIGTYTKQDDHLIARRMFKAENMPNLRDYYSKLSLIQFKGQRTYKIFSKKTKEITEQDFLLFDRMKEEKEK